jgi:hypothetical protein
VKAEPVTTMPRGPYQGSGIIGEVTEALHAWLADGWPAGRPAPRIEEDIEFEPKDREEVVYVYLYRIARNADLLNHKRWRRAKVSGDVDEDTSAHALYERPPLYLDLYYMVATHAKFRSNAERILGHVLMRLHEATHLLYRPRRYVLPDGAAVDSLGRPWDPSARDGVIMEKVSVDIVDDLPLGDAVHFFNIFEAPYRPYVTYRARVAMEGALISAPPTMVRAGRLESVPDAPSPRPGSRASRARLPTARRPAPFGPQGTEPKPSPDSPDED